MSLHQDQPRLASRALGLLYLAGAAILLMTISLPGRRGADMGALLAIFAVACLAAAVLLAWPDAAGEGQRHLAVAFGALLISLVVYFGRQSDSALAVFYVWVAVYSGYFFSRRAFVLHTSWAAVAYAVVLAVQDQGAASIARWVATIAIAAVTGGLMSWLGSELRRGAERELVAVRRSEQALRRLAMLIEQSADAIISKSPDAVITEWNQGAAELYGYSPEEAIGRPISMLVPEDRRDEERELLEQALAGRSVRKDTVRLRKGGSPVEVSLTVSPVHGPDGDVTAAAVIARDVGEAKRLERELHEAEEPFRVAFEHAPIGMALTSPEGVFLRVNQALSEMLGRPVSELAGISLFEVTHPEDRARDGEALRSMLTGERSTFMTEKRYLHADGHVVWVSLSASLVRDAAGRPRYFVSQMRDITEQVRSAAERERALADLEEAQEIATLGSWTWDPASKASIWSRQMYRILDRNPEEGAPSFDEFLAHVHPDDRGRASAGYAQVFGGGPGFELDFRILSRDRRVRHVHTVGRADPDLTGCYTGTIQDVTDLRAAELAARAAEERFRRIFDGAPIGIALASATGVIEEANLAMASMAGRIRSELHGTHLRELLHPADGDEIRAVVSELAAGGADESAVELRLVPVTGAPLEVALHAAWLHGEGKRPGRILCQLQDVTERKRFEAQLQFMADHDPLTGLLNRRKFEEELHRHVAHVKRYGPEGALVVLDIDHFKSINDTLGHSVGDELIVSIAGVLARRLRESDILARLGGDEFAVLLPRADEAEAAHVARSLAMAIRTSTALLSGERRHITASVGVAMFDRENPGELTAEMVEIEADLAMYDAKEAGRDGYSFYETSPQRASRTKARLTWAARIQDALEESRFTLVAQPILDLRTGQIHQHELLIRMLDDDGDLIPPATFLYIAERFGLIVKIDRWVIRRAIELVGRRPDLQLSVNISGHSLSHAELPAEVAAMLQASSIDPGQLTFEVTETAAVANIAQAQTFAHQLGDLGCHFALDDFGAGFGSFYYLKHLPFDYVKIDGEFVQHAGTGHIDRLVIEAVVGIAQGLGKETVAEFVTTKKTQRMVRRLGVDYAQGHHIGPPVRVEELLRDEPRSVR